MKFLRISFFRLPQAATWCACLLVCLLALAGLAFKEGNQTSSSIASKQTKKIRVKVEKTEEQWKESLTPEQFRILRKAGTERPNGKVYDEFKKQGTGVYFCVGCDTELFSSNEKFDSHCGWPSFFDPSQVENVKTSVDYLLGYPAQRYSVQSVTDIWAMSLQERVLIRRRTRDFVSTGQF